jgi:uncharacterized protein YgiM (DUF1202 family)
MKAIQKLRLLFTMLFVMAVAVANAQSMKMVIDSKGRPVGRLVEIDETSYIVSIQDNCHIDKKGHRVVTFSAKNGQGVVYRNQTRTGNINVRKAPSIKSRVIAKIADTSAMGYVPETYPCLGKVKGWYKIRINGKVGYVREDLAVWDGMDTF